ncbi:hypothetical protein KEM54_003166 [Ascosphaera aggregata]|nr:hypothetical protein KEM54_003166 [Ascosphaera aggregata]
MPPKEDTITAAKADHTQDDNITVTVNVDDFSRTRDRVVYTLAALQSAVADLQRAFVTHADTILNMGGVKASTNASLIGVPSLNGILESGAAAGLAAQTSGIAGGVAAQKDAAAGAGATSDSEDVEKGKKKKRKHDPNAPKRPLTPYFLYMQQNRLKIAEEMPADKRPQDVSNEGTRRWQAMSEEERSARQSIYAKQYLQNLEVYRAKMEAYKAGRPVPDDATIAADLQLQKDVERDVESATASAVDAAKGSAKGRVKGDKATASETGTDNSSSSSSDEEPSSPSSSSESEAQKSASKRRRRTAKEIAADKEKEKKKGSVTRSGAKKEGQMAARSTDSAETPTKTPKSTDKATKKRKRKSEVAAE